MAGWIVPTYKSGTPVSKLAYRGSVSRSYVHQILAAEELRDRVRMDRFHEHRRNLGRPIDMGGPRDEWVDRDIFD